MSHLAALTIKSSSKTRGKRLKSLRKMADLSRKSLALKHQISASTIQAWEEGKAGGLTIKGAHRIVSALRKEGLFCTVEWLLSGTGQKPYLSENLFLGPSKDEQPNAINKLATTKVEAIMQELLIFRQLNKDVIDMVVSDDGMLPFYRPGDTIAGKKYYQDKIGTLAGRDCIVETQSGEILFRRLRKSMQPGCYHLQCIWLDTNTVKPFIYDAKLLSAAPVIWHRRVE